jgi:hypothetical protein
MECRVIEGNQCEMTQGCNANHVAFDIVNKGYTLGNIVAHSKGVVVATRNNCNKTYSSSNAAIADWGDSYGNFVLLKHGTLYSFYAHMAFGSVCVAPGQEVKQGQKIGYMGNTGHSNGGHLHFEIRTGESWTTRINPTPYFNVDLAIEIAKPKARDENKEQVEIIYDDNMRVRTSREIKDNNILGILPKGFYDVLSKQNANGYDWVEVKEGQYVALIGGYSELRSKVDKIPTEEEKCENGANNDELEAYKKEVEAYKKEIELLNAKIDEYEYALKRYYIVEKDGLYAIELKKGQVLYLYK